MSCGATRTSSAPGRLELNVWSGESRFGMTCLFVAVPEQGIREGNGAEGCSPEGLDTIAEMGRMEGDGLTRFVLRGDHVNVYIYVRAADRRKANYKGGNLPSSNTLTSTRRPTRAPNYTLICEELRTVPSPQPVRKNL